MHINKTMGNQKSSNRSCGDTGKCREMDTFIWHFDNRENQGNFL